MVKRKVTKTVAKVLVYNHKKKACEELEIEYVGGSGSNRTIMRHVKSSIDSDKYKIVDVIETATKEVIYQMSINDFVEHAQKTED